MSLAALTITTNLLQKKKYTEDNIQKCLFETCYKTKLGPNDVIFTLLEENTKNIDFPVLLEGYGMFDTVEEGFKELSLLLLKIKEDTTFKFSFKSYDNRNTLYFTVKIVMPTTFNKKYKINTSNMSFELKKGDLKKLDTKEFITDLKLRYLTSSNINYDSACEGYDEGLESDYEKYINSL